LLHRLLAKGLVEEVRRQAAKLLAAVSRKVLSGYPARLRAGKEALAA